MIKTLVFLEVGLAAAIFLLAAAQYLGLSQARREGRTQNISRLVTYGTLMALTVIYAVGNLIWLGSAPSPQDMSQMENLPTVNWTFLIIAVMIGILAAWDLVTHIRFVLTSLPHYKPRLMTALAMVLLMILLVGLNLARWEVYLDDIQDTYVESIPGGSAG
jgi:magnesium-transporting ATPase (P-type)